MFFDISEWNSNLINCQALDICPPKSTDRMFNSSTIVHDDSGSVALENLYPALLQCFAIILCGYTAGRLNLVSSHEAKGLNMFISTFSLPSLIFLSLAQLDLSSVNWLFLASILLSKAIVFLGVIIVTFCISRQINFGKPGIYAIFCTQSNDFAIGYPILLALYSQSHPEYPSYLYLMAPISLAILNPISYVLMELGKNQKSSQELQIKNVDNVERKTDCCCEEQDNCPVNKNHVVNNIVKERECDNKKQKFKFCLNIFKNIFTNPVVFMTVFGIIGNQFYQHLTFLTGILKAFGSAFSSTSLFVLGLRMVGNVRKLKGGALVVPGVLIAVKLLVFPLVTREVVSLLHPGVNTSETLDLSTFGFLYGTFPTAPAVYVFSVQYNIEIDMISSSMIACTFISAPLMFISAKMTSLDKSSPDNHYKDLDSFGLDLSIIGAIVGGWMLILFIVGKKFTRLPHKVTGFLIISQIMVCVGMILWSVLDRSNSWAMYFQFAIFTFGVYSSRIWTCFLAITLLLLQTRSLCFALKLTPFFVFFGWGIPVVLVTVLCLTNSFNSFNGKTNPNFEYGTAQAAITTVVLLLSFFVTSGCLILQQRYHRRYARYLLLVQEVNSRDLKEVDAHDEIPVEQDDNNLCPTTSTTHFRQIVDIEEIVSDRGRKFEGINSGNSSHRPGDFCPSRFNCTEEQRESCSSKVEDYNSQITNDEEIDSEVSCQEQTTRDQQILRHVVLLLLLITSMFVGVMLSIWTLVIEDPLSGIYVELSFLDVTLNMGQILLTFAVFGLEAQTVFTPIINWWRRVYYGADTIILTPPEDLSFETIHICNQFINHHLDKCKRELAKDIRWRLQMYNESFRGKQLVCWLQEIGLAKDAGEAVEYASHLLEGRVLKHVENRHHFSNSSLLYTFKTT